LEKFTGLSSGADAAGGSAWLDNVVHAARTVVVRRTNGVRERSPGNL